MAVPRIFLSSTFYDLRQVRNNIGDFIKSLGYEPVMHERSGVAYTQNKSLEDDCYREIFSCDIVVCVIGNHIGTKADKNDLSITMNELNTAIKNKKKIYIFVAKDVFIENRTYEQNKDNLGFKSAYTDDIKIHEFISELKNNTRNNPIESFETTDDIIKILKTQFAGVFQNLLAREASLTDSKTAYDLQESVQRVNDIISNFRDEKEEFFKKFDSSIFASNPTLTFIKSKLGMEKSAFFARNAEALDEFMSLLGFEIDLIDDFGDYRKYVRSYPKREVLIMKDELFDESGRLKLIYKMKDLEKYLIWTEDNDDDVPF